MFGYVTTNHAALSQQQKDRYAGVYCGICRQIHSRCSQLSRLALSNDMVFLALLLMSLYEPEENEGANACLIHPLKRRPWVDNAAIQYAADMNVALAYYNALDDWQDDGKLTARLVCAVLQKHCQRIEREYPRQIGAIQSALTQLSQLERENCANPDIPAGVFGALMEELFIWKEDLWTPTLRRMGNYLGRFIYLTDAALDYDADQKKGSYNPFLASGQGKDAELWFTARLLIMGRCTDAYERLPLVQDKGLLDNILYSGVWSHRNMGKKEGRNDDSGSL